MEKRHRPTQKRLEKARSQGRTIKSRQLSRFGQIVSVYAYFRLIGSRPWLEIAQLLNYSMLGGDLSVFLSQSGEVLVVLLLAPLVILVVSGSMCELFQLSLSGGGVTPKPELLSFRMEKLNPGTGVFRVLRNIWFAPVLLLNALVLLVVIGLGISPELVALLTSTSSFAEQFWAAELLVGKLLLLGVLVLCLGAGVEYFFQRRSFYRAFGMSDHDLRQESREQEGDPLLKGFRRSAHEALSYEEVVSRVRRSKVIVVQRAV
jgi:flagellar biosynthesis protein FlhB